MHLYLSTVSCNLFTPTITMPTGSMSIEQVFENVKVNGGIKDGVFAIK